MPSEKSIPFPRPELPEPFHRRYGFAFYTPEPKLWARAPEGVEPYHLRYDIARHTPALR